MKKRLLSILLLATLLVSILSMTSCGLPSMINTIGAEHSFEYSGCLTMPSYSQMRDSLSYDYADTTLYLYKNGTWSINMTDPSLFVDSVLWKGTYTVEDGVYTFEGFEYDLVSTEEMQDDLVITGEMQDDNFNIYFRVKDSSGHSTIAFKLCFSK